MGLKDKAVTIIVFMIFLNAVSNVALASGIADDMGLNPGISGGEDIDRANERMQNIQPSGGFAGTLFQLYTSVTGPVRVVLEVLFGAELMLTGIGVPTWVVDFVLAPKFMAGGGTIIYMLTQRDL